ncbi:hypothetical protein IWZ03DRAFT_106071 [Phyllosticta citriasiana]|uniref:Uncharacterized protein n=1 Tax=Phyllosticta citriasiana TaxID=595635 RepID=A0ABR1KUU7_9PEZI
MYTMFCPSHLAALISVYQPLCSAARGKSGSPFPTVLRNEHAMPCHAMSKPVGAAVCVVHWQKQRSTYKQTNPTSQSRAMHPSRMISEETVVMSATYLSCCSCFRCCRRRRRLLMQFCGGASGPPALSHSLDSTPRTPASCVFFNRGSAISATTCCRLPSCLASRRDRHVSLIFAVAENVVALDFHHFGRRGTRMPRELPVLEQKVGTWGSGNSPSCLRLPMPGTVAGWLLFTMFLSGLTSPVETAFPPPDSRGGDPTSRSTTCVRWLNGFAI